MKHNIWILILFTLVFAGTARGANMCVKNDVVMIALDPEVTARSVTYNQEDRTWSATFSYGVISGIAACTAENLSYVGEIPSNQDLDPYAAVSNRCVCKMLRPVQSQWAYSGQANNCSVGGCAWRCGAVLREPGQVALLLRGMFSSIVVPEH